MSGSNIAFVLTGSVAAYKACDAVSRLVQLGHRVRAVATPSALRFVGAATLEGLTGERVLSDLFEPGAALEHIRLGRWADAIVVCPATANTINRLAAGLADDLPGALFLAHDRSKPFIVAPAMNPAMWSHPATRGSVSRLAGWGVRFVEVASGRTACGEVGDGRMAEPAAVVAAVESSLARPARALRVLVTSGGTAEPIDGVRVITNLSTGRTGALIADRLAGAGHEVVHLRAGGSARASRVAREETFTTFADLDASLGRALAGEHFDAVVHCAAVGDFGVAEVHAAGRVLAGGGAKLDSDSAPVIHLKTHPKLVDGLRGRSRNAAVRVVAFKLTRGAGAGESAEAVRSLFAHSQADLVVHNDLAERDDPEAFPATIHFRGGGPPARCATRAELAGELERILAAGPAPALA
jgi:phosphopantothenoylcysteine decarboxylase/phosphopantothenate--cysteine ligase